MKSNLTFAYFLFNSRIVVVVDLWNIVQDTCLDFEIFAQKDSILFGYLNWDTLRYFNGLDTLCPFRNVASAAISGIFEHKLPITAY